MEQPEIDGLKGLVGKTIKDVTVDNDGEGTMTSREVKLTMTDGSTATFSSCDCCEGIGGYTCTPQ